MSGSSNIYASSVYSEHPIAIWPLDDDVSFISLITDTDRKFMESDNTTPNWTLTNCTATNTPTLPDVGSPFLNSNIYSQIIGNVPAVDGTDIDAVSPGIFIFEDISQYLETFSINLYLYQDCQYVNYYEIGYRYYDNFTSSYKDVVRQVTVSSQNQWINFNFTFNVEEFDSDYCYLVIRANVNTGGGAGDYNFIMNGLSVGQWSETTSSVSLGSITTTVDPLAEISLLGVEAEQYGVLSENAYYLVDTDNSLLAKNEGVPMVFGSSNVTRLYPAANNQSPSFIFPGKGMLAESGRYSEYTLEFWLRVYPETKETRRIVGPLDSDYGLYVSEGFLTLLIGDRITTHNVGEWYRPMLINIALKQDAALLIINGEEVGQIKIDRSTMVLPTTNEYWGFYSYSDINLFEIDCISIMPYAIATQVTKRRFVWGQATEDSTIIDSSYQGQTALVSFPNAQYTANKIYPDIERWDAGYYNNFTATKLSISTPEYSLPTIFLSGRNIKEWYDDNNTINELEYPNSNHYYSYYYNPIPGHPKFITFRPNLNSNGTEWVRTGTNWTEQCYLNFATLSFLSSPLSAFYAIFEIEDNIATSRPLIHIVNSLNGKRFEINVNGFEVTYNFDGTELYSEIIDYEHFVVGLHIPTFADQFSYELASFFGALESLQMFIGGDGITTFEGKIYRVGFSDSVNFESIQEHFDANGVAIYDDANLLVLHYASYTLSPFFRYNRFFLDISVAAQWEEYYPLTFFASYVRNVNGSSYYDLDYLQLNFGYPSITDRIETLIQNTGWTYAELDAEYSYPVQKSYEILDNENLTGYTNYNDLDTNSVVQVEIETYRSSLDAFITFQLLAEGADEPLDNFTHLKELTSSFVVDAAAENTNIDPYKAYKTKFRVVDGVVIYPPKNIEFEDVALVVHFVANLDGILSNPLKINSLEISSKALNQTGLTPINTKTGIPMYPYVKNGIYYNGKQNNPISIYKNDTPYLYLTRNSGISVKYTSSNAEYGIIVPINESKQNNFSIGALQVWLKYDLDDIVGTPVPIFDVAYDGGTIEFVMISDTTARRGFIYARDKETKITYEDLTIYQNGIEVTNAVIMKEEWNVLSISFNPPLPCSQYIGSINLFHGFVYNNVSVYKSSGLNEFSYIIPKSWASIYQDTDIDPNNNLTWRYWYGTGGNNILANPGFETNTSGYSTGQAAIVRTNSASYSGSYSANVVMTSTTDPNVINIDAGQAVTSGKTYIVSGMFYTPVGSTAAGRTITLSGSGGSGYTNDSANLLQASLTAGTWSLAQRQMTFSTTSAPAIMASISGNLASISGASIYADGFCMQEYIPGAELNTWRDIYVLSEETSFAITASDIYSNYIGTNIFVIDDNTGMSIEEDDFSVFAQVEWQPSYINKPV